MSLLETDCGDVDEIEKNGGILKPETECKTVCPGDPRYYCGQGARLTYYTWSLDAPLYKWNYPTGNDAGNYRLYVPGVVVPLIVTLGVNGKVTFVEKAGTGPPNSTGSFELDPSKADNFSEAWRTMRGLKTDPFCGASLTLPDKAGRQINIGGWSGTSLVSFPLKDLSLRGSVLPLAIPFFQPPFTCGLTLTELRRGTLVWA